MGSFVLEVTDGYGRSRSVPIQRTPFAIGRDEHSDLLLDDSMVSRRHATIEKSRGRLIVRDRHSRNGTFVNGQRIEGPHVLTPGDALTIGPYVLALSQETRISGSSLSGQPGSVDFFAPSPSWNPLTTMAADLVPTESAEERVRALQWDRLLALLVSGSLQELYDAILQSVERIAPFNRCFLILFDDAELERLRIVATRSSPPGVLGTSANVHVSRGVLRRVVESGEAVTVSFDQSSFDPTESFILSRAQSLLCVPLVTRSEVLGVLYVDRLEKGRPFSEEAVKALAPLAGLVALKIENVRLVETHVETRVRQRELEIAKAVQEKYLPEHAWSRPGYALETFNRPCRDVGGDCLDVVEGEAGKLTFAIGDVTGKGLPAALYMVGVLSTLRAHLTDGAQLDEVMARLSRYVRQRFRPDHFLTLLLAELDTASGVVSYCNAGHVPPAVFDADGGVSELESADPALNIAPTDDFELRTHLLEPGSLLFVYTDGLTEKRGEDGALFGKERLLERVRRRRAKDLVTIREEIIGEVEAFGAEPSIEDDATLILLRRASGTLRLAGAGGT